MNESGAKQTIQTSERGRRHRWLAVAAAVAALVVATPVAAHSGAFGPAFGPAGGPAGGPGYGMHGTFTHGGAVGGVHPGMRAPRHGGTFGGDVFGGMHGGMHGRSLGHVLAPAALQRLPLGTDVTVDVFDADPAEGAQPVATLTATVGETSEVAFAGEVQAAAADAAFVTVGTGPRTARVALDVDAAPRRAPMAGLMRFGALEPGQTVQVAFFGGQDDAAPSTTLTFTYGEDSAAAFQQAVVDAAAEAAVAEVALPAQVRTVDLSATPWSGARDATGARGYGMGRGDERGYGPGMGRHVQPGGGFGPRAVPSVPPTD